MFEIASKNTALHDLQLHALDISRSQNVLDSHQDEISKELQVIQSGLMISIGDMMGISREELTTESFSNELESL